jgi:predicted nucleic acid-binding protein
LVLAYFDTCVWISAFFTNNSNHAKAISIFQKVKNSDYVVMVTHQLLNEILDVLKTKATVATRNEALAVMQTKLTYQRLSLALLSMPNVYIKNPSISSPNLFKPCFALLFKYIKGISFANNCPICHNNYNYVEADTIFRDDALHVMLAWALNCDVFVTFDKDFNQLVNEPLLQPMKINVI